MKRRQDLEDEESKSKKIFFSKEEAVGLLKRHDRSILALTYRWLTAKHPDPYDTTLKSVRSYLQARRTKYEHCGLFWDFASLPQKDKNGERSPDEQKQFKKAIEVMGNAYASMTRYRSDQSKHIPERPEEYNGLITLFGYEKKESPRHA